MIYFDFPFILTSLVIISGLFAFIDILFFARKRAKKNKKQPWFFEYARSFFPLLLLVWVIRSFIIQPYRVPSGSLAPTVFPGDFIAVSQFSYGLRLPVLNYKIVNIGEPKRGDIVLFHWPKNPGIIFVKRLVGLPGDHVVYKNKVLTINDETMKQEYLNKDLDIEPTNNYLPVPVQRKIENLQGIKHQIFVREEGGEDANIDVIVPPNCYFMMGDNRDDSDDSRDWGCVPDQNLIGKAFVIWMSWDSGNNKIRWQRIGEMVK
jgi:signal peptidase I